MSTQLQNPTWPQIPDGFEFPRSSTDVTNLPPKTFKVNAEWSALKPHQQALLLGGLLGDGHIDPNGFFRLNHGLPQREYLWTKYTFLAEYVRGSPSISTRNKLGFESVGFFTATAPAFKYLRTLCYPGGIRTVTQAWLDEIDKVGFLPCMAWLVGDDGSLQKRKGYVGLRICTDGFTKKENELLRDWLTKHGYEACVLARKAKGGKGHYWFIHFTAAATAKLAQALAPWTSPRMQYKLDLTGRVLSSICAFCGNNFTAEGVGRKFLKECLRPCCNSDVCVSAKRASENEAYKTPERTETQYQKRRLKYKTDPGFRTATQAYGKRYMTENPEKAKLYKQRYLAKQKEKVRAQVWTCAMCKKEESMADGKNDRLVCAACFPEKQRLAATTRWLKKKLQSSSLTPQERVAAEARMSEIMVKLAPCLRKKD